MMNKGWILGAALAATAVPGAAFGQDGAKLDCIPAAADRDLKDRIGTGISDNRDPEAQERAFRKLDPIVRRCAAKHGVADALAEDYFSYGVARIARDWLIAEIAKAGLSTGPVDTVLDFGVHGANPDLENGLDDDMLMSIVAAYQKNGVDVQSVDQRVWEQVGAYAGVTSIYWNSRSKLMR